MNIEEKTTHIGVRVPAYLVTMLRESAAGNDRKLSQEIVARLKHSFKGKK